MNDCKRIYDAKLDQTMQNYYLDADEMHRRVLSDGRVLPYRYIHGGSGGGYKAMACIENTNAWDDAALYMINSPYFRPNNVTMRVKGQRVLRHVFPRS